MSVKLFYDTRVMSFYINVPLSEHGTVAQQIANEMESGPRQSHQPMAGPMRIREHGQGVQGRSITIHRLKSSR